MHSLVGLILSPVPSLNALTTYDVTNSWSHISATYTSPSGTPTPPHPLFKLQTTPLRMTSTLYSEQIEVLFCLLVNILHTISDIYMTAKKKKNQKPQQLQK